MTDESVVFQANGALIDELFASSGSRSRYKLAPITFPKMPARQTYLYQTSSSLPGTKARSPYCCYMAWQTMPEFVFEITWLNAITSLLPICVVTKVASLTVVTPCRRDRRPRGANGPLWYAANIVRHQGSATSGTISEPDPSRSVFS